jgi:hypothetical protein
MYVQVILVSLNKLGILEMPIYLPYDSWIDGEDGYKHYKGTVRPKHQTGGPLLRKLKRANDLAIDVEVKAKLDMKTGVLNFDVISSKVRGIETPDPRLTSLSRWEHHYKQPKKRLYRYFNGQFILGYRLIVFKMKPKSD